MFLKRIKIAWKQFRCPHDKGQWTILHSFEAYDKLCRNQITFEEYLDYPILKDERGCLTCGKVWTFTNSSM
jgi:hypothetical protein